MKRAAKVPASARIISHHVSKADLLEAAWSLASLANEAGSCDDDASTFERLLAELTTVGCRVPARILDKGRQLCALEVPHPETCGGCMVCDPPSEPPDS